MRQPVRALEPRVKRPPPQKLKLFGEPLLRVKTAPPTTKLLSPLYEAVAPAETWRSGSRNATSDIIRAEHEQVAHLDAILQKRTEFCALERVSLGALSNL